MHTLQKFRRSVADFYRRPAIRRSLSDLAATDPRIFSAIIDTAKHRVDNTEKTWIESIEALRSLMAGSNEVLEILDYGARDGDSNLIDDAMYQGKLIRLTIVQVCTATSRTDRTALLLFRLVRELQPRTCIELGTSVGISACYQATALKLNRAGRLVTLEGADSVASIATQNFGSLGLDNVEVVRGRFQDTLSRVLSANSPLDYAFIDGHHDEAATVKYFTALLPALAGASTVVFDDIRWSPGMKRAWDVIKSHPKARLSVDLRSMGIISMAGDRDSPPRHFHCQF